MVVRKCICVALPSCAKLLYNSFFANKPINFLFIVRETAVSSLKISRLISFYATATFILPQNKKSNHNHHFPFLDYYGWAELAAAIIHFRFRVFDLHLRDVFFSTYRSFPGRILCFELVAPGRGHWRRTPLSGRTRGWSPGFRLSCCGDRP